jgi:hypothetical protein
MVNATNGNGNGLHAPGLAMPGQAAATGGPPAATEPTVPKPPPAEVLQKLATAANGRDRAMKMATHRFDAEPVRAQLLSQAKGILSTIDPAVAHLEELKVRKRKTLEATDPFVKVSNPAAANLSRVERLKHLPLLLVVALALTVLASMGNGYFFVSQSGFEFIDGVVEALIVSCIFSLAPTILAKYTLMNLSDRTRHRVELVLKCVSLPTAALALGLFAVVFGNLMEPYDLMASAADRPWQAPIWVVLGASMALDALASTALVGSISASWRMKFPDVLVENPDFAAAERAVADIIDRLGKFARERESAQGVLNRFAAQRAAYAEECLAVVDYYREEYAAALQALRLEAAQAKSEFLTARLRSAGPVPHITHTISR